MEAGGSCLKTHPLAPLGSPCWVREEEGSLLCVESCPLGPGVAVGIPARNPTVPFPYTGTWISFVLTRLPPPKSGPMAWVLSPARWLSLHDHVTQSQGIIPQSYLEGPEMPSSVLMLSPLPTPARGLTSGYSPMCGKSPRALQSLVDPRLLRKIPPKLWSPP